MTTTSTLGTTPAPPTEKDVRRIVAAAYVGTALEWYDYFLYGTAAAIVFAGLFFPTENAATAAMVALLSFGIGFVVRPLGAVLFSHIGDRYGRRAALIGTIVVMGVATGAIGLLPTYAAIGIAAPVLLTLMRVLQGLSAGGEWGGATLMALEYAPEEKRARYASMVQLGSPTGTVLSSAAFILASMLPEDAFLSWGWRVPFLVAFSLLALALYLRMKVEETPLFKQLVAAEQREKLPVVETFRTASGRLFVGAAMYFIGTAAFFIMTTFMISYITSSLGLPKSLALASTIVGAFAQMAVLVYFGRLADRIGAAKVNILGSAVTVVAAFPVFWLVDTRVPALVLLGVTLGIACISIPYSAIGPALSSLFPAHLQYSGVALSANFSNVLAGFMPFIATWAFAAAGDRSWAPAGLLALVALISLAGSIASDKLQRPVRVEEVL